MMNIPTRDVPLSLRPLLAMVAAMVLALACSAEADPVVTGSAPTQVAAEQTPSGSSADEAGEPAGDDRVDSTASAAEPSSEQTSGAESAETTESADQDLGSLAATPGGDPTDLSLTSIGEFSNPLDIIVRPGDDRAFIVEQTGTITAAQSGTRDRVTVLDVSDRTEANREQGLLGAAFHPTQDLLYVHYTNAAGNSVIAEYLVDAVSGVADVDTERTVLVVEQPFRNHNGGEVDFGPDGYLYLGFGDGGSSGDPIRSSLDLSTPLGKILRIDPRSNGAAPFSIPSDNPFVDDQSADPTIWSSGLRNPWKFSFDPATGDLWIADVGQNEWEEIDAARAVDGSNAGRGVSFGWSAFEGFAAFNSDQPTEDHADPFFTYAREDGRCSISGGAVSRDPLVPERNGWYIYGDFCTGEIFGVDSTGSADQAAIALGQVSELVAIAAGPDGVLYAASLGGTVYRLG